MEYLIRILTEAVVPALVALFSASGLVLVAKVNKRPVPPTPEQRTDTTLARMASVVDILQEEIERRDRQARERDDEIRLMRLEMDQLHRQVSACYVLLLAHGIELPRIPPADDPRTL